MAESSSSTGMSVEAQAWRAMVLSIAQVGGARSTPPMQGGQPGASSGRRMKRPCVRFIPLVLALAAAVLPAPVAAFGLPGTDSSAPGSIDVGFSPEGSAEQLVERALGGARHSIRLSAFSLSSPAIVRELIAARRRGVDVAVIADDRQNVADDHTGKGRAALNRLVNAGIPTRTVSVYSELHDKAAVIDGETVQTGSFNYSVSAAKHNSENAIVVWRDPALAKAYLDHWQSRWEQGVDYRSAY